MGFTKPSTHLLSKTNKQANEWAMGKTENTSGRNLDELWSWATGLSSDPCWCQRAELWVPRKAPTHRLSRKLRRPGRIHLWIPSLSWPQHTQASPRPRCCLTHLLHTRSWQAYFKLIHSYSHWVWFYTSLIKTLRNLQIIHTMLSALLWLASWELENPYQPPYINVI